MLAGCNRYQSATAPFGAEAAALLDMTVVLVVGAVVIAAAVAAMMVAAARAPEGRLSHRGGMRLVLIAGGVVPTIVLTALLIYSLPAMRPRTVAPADLRIRVEGEQFWWRVGYRPAGGAAATPAILSANEIRLPVGRDVLIELTGGDVIHSFWIPGLAGKMDTIPGRINKLPVRATRAGRFRGVCTEFCGLSHALMAFEVVAMPPDAFDRWLAAQARPARPAAAAMPGARLFAANGCGGCHAIRGTGAEGAIGPDLTHFGGRRTLAAGILPMNDQNVARFIKAPARVKPGVRMPAYVHLRDAESLAIARYLQALR